MDNFRSTPPQTIAGAKVMLVHDYKAGETYDTISELRYTIELPKSDVLQFVTQDGTIISVRPSGTEPKIKFYFGVKEALNNVEDYEKVDNLLNRKIDRVIEDLGLK